MKKKLKAKTQGKNLRSPPEDWKEIIESLLTLNPLKNVSII